MDEQAVNNMPEDPVQREIEKLEERNRKEEARIRNLEAKAVQNVNLYFIFQAVILASTSISSSLNCNNWWIPFILSLLAALQNMLAFYAALFKVLKSREDLDQRLAEVVIMKLNKMNRSQTIEQGIKPGADKKWKYRVVFSLCMGLYIGFTAVIMYGCHTILCRSSGGKCVKLC